MNELSYKETDREIKVKIFGLDFNIKDEIEKIRVEDIENEVENDEKIVEKVIDKILGENATKTINEKREKDGYKAMSLDVQTQVLNWIIQQYATEVLKPLKKTVGGLQNNKFKRGRNYNNRYRRY